MRQDCILEVLTFWHASLLIARKAVAWGDEHCTLLHIVVPGLAATLCNIYVSQKGTWHSLCQQSRCVHLHAALHNVWPMLNCADACVRACRFKEAVNECSSALNLNPNYHRALVRRAKANEQLGLFKKALQDIQKANKTDTANPDTQVRSWGRSLYVCAVMAMVNELDVWMMQQHT